jgi:predicted nucleic acid-binding protein
VKLFLDTNVVLDVLAQRVPWVQDSAALLSRIDAGQIQGFVAAHTITTLHYLLSKHLGREKASTALIELVDLMEVAAIDASIIQKGFALGWGNFEDAVQAVCALQTGADYFVTRNPRDFSALSIPVVNPSEVLHFLQR